MEGSELVNAHGLYKVTPLPGWAHALADFDSRIFGSDAWPSAVWASEVRGESTYIAYIRPETAEVRINCRPEIVALGGVSAGPEAEILTIAVAPHARRMGLGSELLTELMEIARARGAEQIFLEVRAADSGAQEFYLRHGFSAVGFRRHYYLDDDAVIMRYDVFPARSGA